MQTKEKATPAEPGTVLLRFKTGEQRERIREAAKVLDRSMNSFIRTAAEKAAERVLRKGKSDA